MLVIGIRMCPPPYEHISPSTKYDMLKLGPPSFVICPCLQKPAIHLICRVLYYTYAHNPSYYGYHGKGNICTLAGSTLVCTPYA